MPICTPGLAPLRGSRDGRVFLVVLHSVPAPSQPISAGALAPRGLCSAGSSSLPLLRLWRACAQSNKAGLGVESAMAILPGLDVIARPRETLRLCYLFFPFADGPLQEGRSSSRPHVRRAGWAREEHGVTRSSVSPTCGEAVSLLSGL